MGPTKRESGSREAPSTADSGAIHNETVQPVEVRNSIVSGNTAGGIAADLGPSGSTGGFGASYSLLGTTNGAKFGEGLLGPNLIGIDPRLSPPALNGGRTPTMLPASDSPVVNAGLSGLATDQRGLFRPVDFPTSSSMAMPGSNRADLGAVELQSPPIERFQLTVGKAGTGQGTVSSAPAGIDCGADCTEDYDPGSKVALAATAAAGSDFEGWSGACSGTGACLVTLDQARSVIAEFKSGTPAACPRGEIGTPPNCRKPDESRPRLGALKITPKARVARRGKAAVFRVRLGNAGTAPTARVKLCASAPKRLVSVPKCKSVAPIAAGKSRTVSLRFTVRKQARPGKKAKVRFTATGRALTKRVAAASITVK